MPASSEPQSVGSEPQSVGSEPQQAGAAAPGRVPAGARDSVERTVVLAKHLHARPAGQIAQAAARHPAVTIGLSAGAKRANARSVLAVMALGAVSGSEVTVSVTGPDADTIMDGIVEILLAPEE
jgi:phosphocarrier protein HPr